MSFTVHYRGKHECVLPDPMTDAVEDGAIAECNICNIFYKLHKPGNPKYSMWRRVWRQKRMRRYFRSGVVVGGNA